MLSSIYVFHPPLLASRDMHCLHLTRARQAFKKKTSGFCCRANQGDAENDYLIDAPVSVGDGFSFSGGKYSDGPARSDEWFSQGKIVKAHPVLSSVGKAKDPIFGLTLGVGSQASNDVFRWFCVEEGNAANPSVILIHGFPSQAYSFRKVLPVLSKGYHVIAFDWLDNKKHPIRVPYENTIKKNKCHWSSFVHGFGFSDKPQPKYGFDYTLDEYVSSLGSLIGELALDKFSLVAQGYFAPVVVKYASNHQDKLKNIILVNPPLTDKHAKLPSTLSSFSNFLLGEIFSQDPLRASDKTLSSCGPYAMKEEDAMVYRRPYLTSGSSGFALTAISRAMKKELKAYVEDTRKILSSPTWKVCTTICWGLRDCWLNYDGIEDFCKGLNHELVELPQAGHHVQEDCGKELGQVIARLLAKN